MASDQRRHRLAPLSADRIPASPLGVISTGHSRASLDFVTRTAAMGAKWLGLRARSDTAFLVELAETAHRLGMEPFLWGRPDGTTLRSFVAVARHPRPLLRHVLLWPDDPAGEHPPPLRFCRSVGNWLQRLTATAGLTRPYVVVTLPRTAGSDWVSLVVERLRGSCDAWLLTARSQFLDHTMAANYRIVRRAAPRTACWLLVRPEGADTLVRTVVRGACLQPERIIAVVAANPKGGPQRAILSLEHKPFYRAFSLTCLLFSGHSRVAAWKATAEAEQVGAAPRLPTLTLDALAPYRTDRMPPERGLVALVARAAGRPPRAAHFLVAWHRPAAEGAAEFALRVQLQGAALRQPGWFRLPEGEWSSLSGRAVPEEITLSLGARPIFVSPEPALAD